MDPRRKPEQDDTTTEGPVIETQDWEAVESGSIAPDSLPRAEELDHDEKPLEEDDDNPYQNSDEALPDDTEEAALARDPSREGTRFGEV